MSPNVGNFVHDLVEMAKAMETLPQVERDRDEAVRRSHELAETVAERETRIIGLKSDIEVLNTKLREAEVRADNAELMFLELDERTHKVLGDFDAIATLLAAVKRELDPPKPVPAAPVSEAVAVQSAEPVQGVSSEPVYTASGWNEGIEPLPIELQGQREPDPTVQSTAATVSDYAPMIGADTSAAASTPEPAHGPYYGKLFINVPGWIFRDEWLAQGGTHATYDWHEGKPLPEGFYRNWNGNISYIG